MKSLIFSSCVNSNVSRWKLLALRWPNDRTNRPSILNKALHLTTCGDWESSPVKSMCECVFMYSTITAFKPPYKCVLELSSWSELQCPSLKRAAVVLSEALESVQTWHLQQHTHKRQPSFRPFSQLLHRDQVLHSVRLGLQHRPRCYFRDYPVFRGLLCTLTWGFERTWGHLQTSTHQTWCTQTQNTGRGSHTAV